MFKFGAASDQRLNTCHADLQLIMREAIKVSPIDFGISEGLRADAQQLQYFLDGKSRLDPRVPSQRALARHLPNEDGVSMAADVYAYVPNRKDLAYDYNHLCCIAGVILSTAERLFDEGRIAHKVRWGGNWDMDGQIITDQKFNDLPHFELIEA